MHLDLPQALQGWRKIAGEIAIIVVGVVIALGLDQYVQARQWRQQVTQSEEAFQGDLSVQRDYRGSCVQELPLDLN